MAPPHPTDYTWSRVAWSETAVQGTLLLTGVSVGIQESPPWILRVPLGTPRVWILCCWCVEVSAEPLIHTLPCQTLGLGPLAKASVKFTLWPLLFAPSAVTQAQSHNGDERRVPDPTEGRKRVPS